MKKNPLIGKKLTKKIHDANLTFKKVLIECTKAHDAKFDSGLTVNERSYKVGQTDFMGYVYFGDAKTNLDTYKNWKIKEIKK